MLPNDFIVAYASVSMGIDMLWHGQTLFKQPEVFDYAYLPESFEYRSGQLQALADCIKPCFQNLKPLNCKIVGETATGKTTSIKLVFHEAEQESKHLVLVHINGGVFSNVFAVFSRIHKEVLGYEPPSAGISVKDLYEKIFSCLEKKKQSLLVALDDALYIQDLNKVVYDLLRAYELFHVKTGVWLVGTPRDKFALDDKSASVFSGQAVIFPRYTEEELFTILKKRAEYGVHHGVVSDEILRRIAGISFQRDLRFGIELLKMIVLEAENKSKKKAEVEDVERVLSRFSFSEKGEKFLEREILALLREQSFTSGELHAALSKKQKIPYSSFYRLIEDLRKKRMIEVEEKQGDEGGRTREIRLRE